MGLVVKNKKNPKNSNNHFPGRNDDSLKYKNLFVLPQNKIITK